jgi:hypothetical protein
VRNCFGTPVPRKDKKNVLGSIISEGRGKRTGRRVIATQPQFKIEASAEERTTLLGVEGLAIITYTATSKPDGSVDGEGEIVFASLEGDIVTYKGVGVGRFVEGGAIRYCGSVSYTTTSEKFKKLNGVAGVFQWEIDADGNTHSLIREMAPAGVSAAGA